MVVYKGCTRDAQGMHTLESVAQPWCSRCASLVLSAKRLKRTLERDWLGLGRFSGDHCLGLRFRGS
jgi:hypothetical protein